MSEERDIVFEMNSKGMVRIGVIQQKTLKAEFRP